MPATNPHSGIAANIDVKTHTEDYRSFSDLLRFLEEKEVFERKLASNVTVRAAKWTDDLGDVDEIEIVLYYTPIVRYYADGTFSVDNGGFNTPTTSRRITQFTPRWFWAYHENKKLVARAEHCGLPKDFTRYGIDYVVCTHDVKFPVEHERSVD